MPAAPLPEREADRLAALHAHALLDTEPEQVFEDLVRVAANVCGAPIAVISLVDGGRQWFKARVGISACETPRDVAFCAHAILEPQKMLVVEDAAADERFAQNPLVTGPPNIRFYAGVPLVDDDGHALGTLCVIGSQPRTLSAEQRDSLACLARQVMACIESRRLVDSLAEACERNRRAEQDILRARDEALESARLRAQFLANMSHEIRTPLNGVIGMLELMLAEDLEGDQYRMCQVARSSGDALLTLLNDILDLSKMEAGRLDLEIIPFSPEQLGASVCALFEARAREKKLELTLECAKDLPAAVLGDPTRLRQVLTNLVGNALKFTDRGRVVVRVQRGQQEDGSASRGAVHFEVEDTGPGLTAKARKGLFQSFSQGDASTTRRYGGTGLGLAISHQLVDLMGGELDVVSVLGRGARFFFRVPLETAMESAPAALPTRTAIRRRFVDGKGRRVLVVEDNPVNREVVTRMLRMRKYEVEIAVDGEQALAVLDEQSFDLVLMDCQMPVLDGFEATRRIREIEGATGRDRTTILALTASALSDVHRRCLESGMDACLTKPIRMADLDEALSVWIREAAKA